MAVRTGLTVVGVAAVLALLVVAALGCAVQPRGRSRPEAAVAVADGIVYVAGNGTLTATDAKTLQPLKQATYWQRPQPQPQASHPRGGTAP